ncbi:MAG TPA: hypothetical protein VFN55_12735 [Solirubrobacteraceae bacterium]|nr:hypothetical protein [Solirubrobacteraceae bacterium]
MSDLTITRTRPPTPAHRARVLSEAVVSAYLRDISAPRRTTRIAPALALAVHAAEPGVASAPTADRRAPGPRRARPRSRAARRRSPLALSTAAAVQALRRP